MKRTEAAMVAYALEIDASLLPHVPELLADLDELGSDAEAIVAVLESLELPESTSVVDLGSGKGAVALEVAEDLGWPVLGIELFEHFVEISSKKAQDLKLSGLCRFQHGNIANLAGTLAPFDVAIYAALGDVLGRLDATIKVIRDYVKPGGYLVISDVYIVPGGTNSFPGFENYANHQETLRRLTAQGDRLVQEIGETTDAVGDDVEETEAIYQRATKIGQRFPALKAQLAAFAENQQAQNEYAAKNLAAAIWVLQKC